MRSGRSPGGGGNCGVTIGVRPDKRNPAMPNSDPWQHDDAQREEWLGPIFFHFQYLGAAAWHGMVVMLTQTRQSCPGISATAKVSCLSATTTIRSWGPFCVGKDSEGPERSVSKMSVSLHHPRASFQQFLYHFGSVNESEKNRSWAGIGISITAAPVFSPETNADPISRHPSTTKLIPGAPRPSDFSPSAPFSRSLPFHPSPVLLRRRSCFFAAQSLVFPTTTSPPPSP